MPQIASEEIPKRRLPEKHGETSQEQCTAQDLLSTSRSRNGYALVSFNYILTAKTSFEVPRAFGHAPEISSNNKTWCVNLS